MDYQAWSSLTAMFFAQARKGGDKPFVWAKQQGTYRALSWQETATRVTEVRGSCWSPRTVPNG